MNKKIFVGCIYLIYKWIQKFNKYCQNYGNFCPQNTIEKILTFIYNTSEIFEFDVPYLILIMIYFKRILFSNCFEYNPYIYFILSFIISVKFQEDNHYRNMNLLKCCSIENIKKIIYEYEILLLKSNINLHICEDTYKTYYNYIILDKHLQ